MVQELGDVEASLGEGDGGANGGEDGGWIHE